MTIQTPGYFDFDAGYPAGQANPVSIYNNQALSIAPGGLLNAGPFNVNNLGYEISLAYIMANTATNPWVQTQLLWYDAGSGEIAQTQDWYLVGGETDGHEVVGTGPARGNQLNLAIFNADPVSTLTGFFMLSSISRFYPRDEWDTWSLVGVPGFTIPAMNPLSDTLASSSVNNGAGATFTRLLPIWNGYAEFCVVPPAGQTTTVTVTNVGDQTAMTNRVIWEAQGAAGVPVTFIKSLPKAQCTVAVTNTGAAGGTTGLMVTKARYPV